MGGTDTRTGSESARDAAALGTATLHEAGAKIGALPSHLRPVRDELGVDGPAFPVSVPPGDNLWLHHAIYAAAPGDVLVVTAGAGYEYGYFGEVMAVAAQERGIAGLVIDGGVRDVQQLRAMGFPVFSERKCIRGTTKNPHLCGSLGKPILIGDVLVHSGDLVVGDADGVVVLPAERAAEIVAQGRSREQDEQRYVERLRAGESTLEIYSLPDVANGDLADVR